jgi:DNA-directed RNA polymerase subunit M/transcription elongation factor TFIIS
MQFCKNCKNKLSTKTVNDDPDKPKIKYFCNSCHYETEEINDNLVYYNRYDIESLGQQGKVNEFTPLDPTLPRIKSIDCPNEKCPTHDTNKKLENEIVYLMYDLKNMKFVYVCTHCLHRWTNK